MPDIVLTPRHRREATGAQSDNFKAELEAKIAQYNLKNSESKND